MNWPLRLAQSVIPPGLHWFLGLKHSQVHGRARWMNAREEHAFLAQDPKVTASILSSARAALDLWSDPEIARLTAAQTVEIRRLRRQPTVIYLIVAEHKIGYFSGILSLFYTACFEHCLTAWDAGDPAGNAGLLPVSFFLDEFSNLGKLDQLRRHHHDLEEAALLGEPHPPGTGAARGALRPPRRPDDLFRRLRKLFSRGWIRNRAAASSRRSARTRL